MKNGAIQIKNDKEKLEELINIIREDFPSNVQERIRYINIVRECDELIDHITAIDPEYINPYLVYNRGARVEYIIGWKAHQPASGNQAAKVKKAYDNKCAVCDFPIAETLNAHHIIPRYLGGKNDLSNLIALCPTCHKIFHLIEDKSGISDVLYNYLQEQGYLNTVLKYTNHLFEENYSLKLWVG